MLLDILAVITCGLAVLPALMFYRNFAAYAPPPPLQSVTDTDVPAVSVLIPARNEAASIGAAVTAALQSEQVGLEVLVLDDHSTDATATIVRHVAAQDARVRLVTAPPLPPGWCGKQHACAVLATQATYPLLLFVDADVRLQPQGLTRLAAFLQTSGADLVSGLPRQETGTWFERLLIPLIHFLLLGFLPFRRMRHSRHPAYGSGCGQLFMARREAYEKAGGHSAIRTSLHDGLTLPRAFRSAGFLTDLCDATDIATCRMYRGAREVWHGLAKNATEGLAAPRLIVPATLLLLGGQVLPVVLFAVGMVGRLSPWAFGLALLGVSVVYYPRLQALRRFAHMPLSAVFHPLGIVVLLAIQWYAYGRAWRGRPVTWKERTYPGASVGCISAEGSMPTYTNRHRGGSMRLYVLERTQFIPQSRAEVFVFFAEAGNLQRITPAFLSFRMRTPLPIHMRPGALIDYQLRLFGLPFRWRTRIATFAPPDRFTDVQVHGPYRYWHHLHEFRPVPGGTEVIDRVEYAMPCGPFGTLVHALCVRHLLGRIFDYRREHLQALFSPGGATSLPGASSGQEASAAH